MESEKWDARDLGDFADLGKMPMPLRMWPVATPREFGIVDAMNRIVGRLGLLMALIFAGVGAHAAESGAPKASKPAVRAEIVAVIEGQLAAFRASEIGKAYAYAATGLRLQMPVQSFARLVRDGYPEIWANTRAEFGLVRDDGRRATLTVRVFARDKTSAAYDYVMLKEGEVWLIAGVLRHETRGEKGT